MGDKRTDPGQYYPGGKVVSQHGVAPPQIIVQWSDVQGKPQIAPLPDKYKDSDVKGKINEIASKFATVVVAALIGWTACADITVQKKRKDQIYNDEQVVVDVTGSGVGMGTNTVIDIANATIATNPVVAAKLDGPTYAPANTAEAAGKAADANLTGIALTNRYTRAEADEKLADKLTKPDEDLEPSSGHFLISDGNGGTYVDPIATFDRFDTMGTSIEVLESTKATKQIDAEYGNLACFDGNGDIEDSGIAKDEVFKNSFSEGLPCLFWQNNSLCLFNYNLDVSGNTITANSIKTTSGRDLDNVADDLADAIIQLAAKADRTMISATNPTFSNEVLKVAVSSLSTNITEEVYIAATNACANLGIDPALIPGAGTTGTVGGFIAMLFVVVFWMRKKIFDNSGKVNDTFAGELFGKSVAINALHYALYSVPTSGADANKLKDRAVNAFTFSGGSLPTFPAQVAGYARDFLLNVTATADGSNITIPEPDGSTATSIGDALAFTAGKTYLVAITEIAAKHYYIRVIDTTPANAA